MITAKSIANNLLLLIFLTSYGFVRRRKTHSFLRRISGVLYSCQIHFSVLYNYTLPTGLFKE